MEVSEWAKKAEELGAGEIMITSIDREGTGLGYDIELTRMISERVSIPVIACGGAGAVEHIAQVISEGNADAVAVASILHYDFLKGNAVEAKAGHEGNIEFLKSGRGFSKIKPVDLNEIKRYLRDNNFICRYSAKTEEFIHG
jgi:cyclase